uniref:RNA-dependent RNA polymerase n=1 Tax=Picobirnavirus wolf/PRT/1109/2015 TaxID=1873468 RepID=A0A1B1LLJ0_9VIRU|nr:RNA-dependent RNA polymerase [Picobirnavirus wolf/PRT/1109/2015]
MPKSNAVMFSRCYDTTNPALKAYFGRVVEGQSKVYDTPFARGESTEQLLNAWSGILDQINDEWPSLRSFENDLRAKVGPMSVMKPLRDRIEDIDHYYDLIHLKSEPISRAAIAAVIGEWAGVRGLQPRTQGRTIETMKKSTNSGSPYFRKRKTVLTETVPCKVMPYKDLVHQQLHYESWDACATLGWRGQEGGPKATDVKQRVVWMFPFAVNVRELQVYQPLIEAAQRFNLVPAWVSMDEVDKRITRLFDTKGTSDLVVCTDFSKFDQHFNEDMQTASNQILASLLNSSSDSVEWLENVHPVKYMIPLAYDWNAMRFGRHGMGSGSGGTNADETLVHRSLQYESAIKAKARLNPNSQCLGDDGILSYPGITVEDVVEAYAAHGQEMNLDKQYASTQDCTYLRRWHHKDYRINGVCVGVYSTFRALGRLRYLERYYDPSMWGPTMVALRQLSIIENVKYHPLREEFAEFCMKRDKYRLGINLPGFLDNIESVSKEAIEYMPDFLGYTKSLQSDAGGIGIKNWWIVNYLKSRA